MEIPVLNIMPVLLYFEDFESVLFNLTLINWCLNRHLCILQERFAKKDLNRKFGHCFL